MQLRQTILGTPKLLLRLIGEHVLELVKYPDGCFGIVRDGASVGIWEADEELECVKALAVFGGLIPPTESEARPKWQVLRVQVTENRGMWN